MGTTIRTMLATLATAGLLAAAAPAAVAGDEPSGQRCIEESNGIKRCAWVDVESLDDFYTVKAAVWKPGDTSESIKYQLQVLMFQRRTDDGWTTVRRTKVRRWYTRIDAQDWTRECDELDRGTYRTKAKARWKRVGSDDITARWITSSALTKREIC